MNRLEKKAWSELGAVTLCVLIAGAGMALMVYMNTYNGIVGLTSFLISGLLVGLISYLRNIKSWTKFDEREQKIAARARALSSGVFILFLYCVSFAVFFIVGPKNPIPAYILPALFLSGIFLAVFVQSAAILVQFARERDDD
jgi:membrane protease YdiL (CAAX protease family)